MKYQIKLDGFEGPFDLLLHLIEQQELNINDISIAEITDQYLDYLHQMEQLDLAIASEFLVMGATLLSIKARTLLPKPQIETLEDEVIDPREELVIRLLEYRKFKAIVEDLRVKEMEQRKVFNHPFNLEAFLSKTKPVNPLKNISAKDLNLLYQETMKLALKSPPVHQVQTEEVTVGKQIKKITHVLAQNKGRITFSELFSEESSPVIIVVTFLALLEMIRLGRVMVFQEKNFSSIQILWCQLPSKEEEVANALC